MEYESWFKELTGGASLREAGLASGISKSTLSRNLDSNHMAPETVIALCRAYGRSPVQGLIETGYVNDYEVEGPDVAIALSKATNQQLLDEIMKRSDPQARYLFGGDEDTIGLSPQLSVVSDASDIDDGTVKPFDYGIPHAADSSIDEDAERESRGEDLID